MADTKISALTAGTTLSGTEAIPAVQSAADVKITPAQIKTYTNAGLATVATSGSASDLTAGTLPVAQTAALTGDVTKSAGASVTTIAAGAVTLAKMANLSANSIVGNNTGSGATPIALTIPQVSSLLGTAQTSAPSSPTSGQQATADGVNWDPLNRNEGKPYEVIYDGTGWVAPAPTPFHPGYVAGRFYCAPCIQGGSVAVSANTMYLHPIIITSRLTLSTLGVRINTVSAGGNVRLCLYSASASTKQPTGTPVASVVVSTASNGFQSTALGANVALSPGLYWLGVHADNGTVVMLGMNVGTNPFGMMTAIGVINTAQIGSGATPLGYSAAANYASGAPDLTSATFTEVNTPGQIPIIWFKAATVP